MKEYYEWQEQEWSSLQNLRERLPGALLLKGAQGIGKLDLALLFAQSLLCASPNSTHSTPCGNCDSCHWFEQGTHPDFKLIQPDALTANEEGAEKEGTKKPSREISVDQIRALANFSNMSSHRGGYRIILLHPAEAMNLNSANALLKTLEEPADKLFFILVTHKPQQLLPTILSRCLSITFGLPKKELSLAWLKKQGVTSPENCLAQAGFSPLLALQHSEDQEGGEQISQLMQDIHHPNQLNPLILAEKIHRTSPALVINYLQQWCYDLVSAKLTGQVRFFPQKTAEIQKLASPISAMRLLNFQNELKVAKREAFHPLNARLQFESILMLYKNIFTK